MIDDRARLIYILIKIFIAKINFPRTEFLRHIIYIRFYFFYRRAFILAIPHAIDAKSAFIRTIKTGQYLGSFLAINLLNLSRQQIIIKIIFRQIAGNDFVKIIRVILLRKKHGMNAADNYLNFWVISAKKLY